ncbi:hypothetical protein LTR87_010333 [Friedmanniomyces endolithicus]|nr:hypothetical protein LTR87_010333 [Friedmanniomyces endolithicus]
MDMPNGETPQGVNGDDHQHIRLACQACQRKKIKCDRNYPCGQCTRSNLQCVLSSRKPRARHAGRRTMDSELRTRISKLENLVDSLSGDVGVPDEAQGGGADAATGDASEVPSPTVGKYLGSPFWTSLSTEVQAIRDALEEDQGEDDLDGTPSDTAPSNGAPVNANDFDLFICPPGVIYVMPGALNEPSPHMQQVLFTAFIENVDPMFKVFHVPTLRRLFEEGKPYLGQDASSPSCQALKAVAWYAAVNTLTDEECEARLGQARTDLIQQYRRTADVRIAQVDVVNTNDLTTLQAFVAYLVATRMTDMSRRVWTMTALVIRIAQAMGLHSKAPARTPFETELRRRLWHQIRFLDVFTAMDRATESLIAHGSFDTPMPTNVNDSEFDEDSTVIPSHETGITDMGFALVAYEARTDLADRAWGVVERNYERQLRFVADTRHGMLWRPIEKLYKKANAFRNDGRRESADGLGRRMLAQRQQLLLRQREMHERECPAQAVPQQSQVQVAQQAPPDWILNPGPPTTFASGAPHHQQPHMPTGSIPLDPMMSGSIDFGFDSSVMTPPTQEGDVSWLDWEHIMDDLSNPMDLDVSLGMGDMGQASGYVAEGGQEWGGGVLPQYGM